MTEKTPEMSIHDVVENLKTMVFGKQAFGRFSAKERETLYAAIYDLECLNAINLDLAYENDDLINQIEKIEAKVVILLEKERAEHKNAMPGVLFNDKAPDDVMEHAYKIDAYKKVLEIIKRGIKDESNN